MNITVEIETNTSARVSWVVVDFPGVTGYIIYYIKIEEEQTEQFLDIFDPSTTTALIEDLNTDTKYLFTVVAVVFINGEDINSPRNMPITMTITASGEIN